MLLEILMSVFFQTYEPMIDSKIDSIFFNNFPKYEYVVDSTETIRDTLEYLNSYETSKKLAKMYLYFSRTRNNGVVDLFIDNYLQLAPNYELDVDPFLLYSQLIEESGEYKYAVSLLGAAGYLQLMPETAKGLGIRNVYVDENYKMGWELRRKYNKIKSQQKKLEERILGLSKEIYGVDDQDKINQIVELNKKYDSLSIEAKKYYYSSQDYFRKYKENLLKGVFECRKKAAGNKEKLEEYLWNFDGRFSDRALYYGMKKMFEDYNNPEINGDERLTLSLYHAGWGNIRNYRKKGNPPEIPTKINSTQNYQNEIMNLKRRFTKEADRYFLNHKKNPKFYEKYDSLRHQYFRKIMKK